MSVMAVSVALVVVVDLAATDATAVVGLTVEDVNLDWQVGIPRLIHLLVVFLKVDFGDAAIGSEKMLEEIADRDPRYSQTLLALFPSISVPAIYIRFQLDRFPQGQRNRFFPAWGYKTTSQQLG